MITLKTKIFPEKQINYDGSQLRPHWIYETLDLMGDAIVAFIGPAKVSLNQMVDLEDVKQKAPIYGPNMLHFIGEWFMDSFDEGILLQHLFVNEIYELLLEKRINNLHRRGNDLYYENRKLSVSIAARSPVSVLMHTALNIETEGTPIPTSGLNEMNISALKFAEDTLERFSKDLEIWQKARVKVAPRQYRNPGDASSI